MGEVIHKNILDCGGLLPTEVAAQKLEGFRPPSTNAAPMASYFMPEGPLKDALEG